MCVVEAFHYREYLSRASTSANADAEASVGSTEALVTKLAYLSVSFQVTDRPRPSRTGRKSALEASCKQPK